MMTFTQTGNGAAMPVFWKTKDIKIAPNADDNPQVVTLDVTGGYAKDRYGDEHE